MLATQQFRIVFHEMYGLVYQIISMIIWLSVLWFSYQYLGEILALLS